ncbi:alpha/beta fold hydrolase [Leptolyngbya sp. FACHB-261]|uniref:alpha/beta fold hydrolase n=1 Tax=Leptolyngbya sp. FACHB-261 TaxID=2692806 RepID=UPI0016835FC7|nr:alpha/beta fold hydrolase [Leptolyngbya sp. FACHB-261]MBD2099654.1 alpha/beta fold hydrolase [Leptolyngbya sp. FACHB-261]
MPQRWIRLLFLSSLTTLTLLVVLSTLNALVESRTVSLHNELPGRSEVYFWRGFRISYSHKGEGPPLLLVHAIGGGASSFEFREVIAQFSQNFSVYALDLLGWGHSERPNLQYTGKLYAELLVDFVNDVIAEPVAVIASSLGVAFALRAAQLQPQRFTRLVAIAPIASSTVSRVPELVQDTVYNLLSLPILSQSFYYTLTSPPAIDWITRNTLYSESFTTDALVEHYDASTHQPGALYTVRSFLSGIMNLPLQDDWQAFAGPVLLVWGRDNLITPLGGAEVLRQLRPDATLEILPGRSFPHLEVPEQFRACVEPFLLG